MSWIDRIPEVVTERRRLVIVLLLIGTVVVGAGNAQVEQSTSFGSAETDSAAVEKQDFVTEEFGDGDNRTTELLVVTRAGDGNALSRESSLRTLRYQRSLLNNETVNETLAEGDSIRGISNVLARAAVLRERRDELTERADRLRERNDSLAADIETLRADAERLSARGDELNRTARTLVGSLTTAQTLQRQLADANETERRQIRSRLQSVRLSATEQLNDSQTAAFERAFDRVRSRQRQLDRLNASYAAGEVDDATYANRSRRLGAGIRAAVRNGSRGVLRAEFAAVERRATALAERRSEITDRRDRLVSDFEQLENDTAALRASPPDPTVTEQIQQLESMSDEEVATLAGDLFGADTSSPLGQLGLQLLPKGYDPGTGSADARMMVITQQTAVDTSSGATLTARTIDGQLAVRAIADERSKLDAIVFGQGFVTTEESRSMSDSFVIIGPLAVVFVLSTLLLAYRDLVDIVVGMVGVLLVLVWTFGLLGWAGIVFNQIMIAVPVLLIGLSIDYNVHVVMRYREERADGAPVTEAMRRSVATVGVALTLVTATTAVGFLTNLTSSLPAIRNFGVVSAAGICAALLIFGVLVPAVKIEIDELLERFGFDRAERAVGTDESRLRSVLQVGVWGAKRAPFAVLVFALLITAGSAYAGTQVDSSFSEDRFISDDPPEWTESLPEPFAPGEYSVKQNLHYIHDHFQTPDSRVSVLVEGNVTDPETLSRLTEATDAAADSPVTYR
ncbi:MAG: putative exporters of the RND superfamily, partial [halophilic archaeon J07HB67]